MILFQYKNNYLIFIFIFFVIQNNPYDTEATEEHARKLGALLNQCLKINDQIKTIGANIESNIKQAYSLEDELHILQKKMELLI